MPIIFQNFRRLFLELFCAEPASNLLYPSKACVEGRNMALFKPQTLVSCLLACLLAYISE